MELAQRIDVSEKLREQVRELEREKRDVQRRYNEQVRYTSTTLLTVHLTLSLFTDKLLDSYIRGRTAGIL